MSNSQSDDGASLSKKESPAPSCHLYKSPVDRIWNEMKEAKLMEGPLQVEDTLAFDQMHYMGTEALDHAASIVGMAAGQRVLDVGSGFGGPARYFASKYGVSVVALELQPELSELSHELCHRMSSDLQGRVTNICGDITTNDLPWDKEPFDVVTGFLVFLHIENRMAAWRNIFSKLRPGGWFVIEDFYSIHPLTPEQQHISSRVVGCSNLCDDQTYVNELREAGFDEVTFVDCTKLWTDWVQQRADDYRKQSERHIRVQGNDIASDMIEFYDGIAKLFQSGALGGVRLSARKPMNN